MFTHDSLLTPKEAAEAPHVSIRKLDYLISSGELPVLKLGKTVRIRPAALSYFIEARENYSRRAKR